MRRKPKTAARQPRPLTLRAGRTHRVQLPHLTDEATEAQRRHTTGPRSRVTFCGRAQPESALSGPARTHSSPAGPEPWPRDLPRKHLNTLHIHKRNDCLHQSLQKRKEKRRFTHSSLMVKSLKTSAVTLAPPGARMPNPQSHEGT